MFLNSNSTEAVELVTHFFMGNEGVLKEGAEDCDQ